MTLSLAFFASTATADEKPEGSDKKTVTGGTIEGTVTYSADEKRPWRYDRYYVDKKNGNRMSDALISLSGASLKSAATPHTPTTSVVDQKNFTFAPETVAIQAGDSIKFTNGDSSSHNVFSRDDLHPFDVTLGGDDEAVETFPRAGGSRRPILVGCKFHGSMRAWIYVFDHPWFQITGRDGGFTLKDVPPGVYHLELTHPAGALRWSKRIEVVAGQTTKLEVALSPDNKVEPPK